MTDLITLPRAVVQQALHVATAAGYPVALIAAPKAALESATQTIKAGWSPSTPTHPAASGGR